MSANEVQGPDTNNKPPKFPDQDLDKAGDQKDQTRAVSEAAAFDRQAVVDADEQSRQRGSMPVTAVDCDGAANLRTPTTPIT